jgi:DNA polymerase elongation subunit (family B)
MNTAYGALACEIPFGDFYQAAMVTAYGRAVVKHMAKVVAEAGGDVRLNDTDSCYWASESPEQAEVIYQELLASMPEGIGLAKEDICPLYFVPPKNLPSDFDKSYKFKSVNGKKLVAKLFGEGAAAPASWAEEKVTFTRLQTLAAELGQDLLLDSTRKSYLKFYGPDRITSKGLLAKRNTSILEKTAYIDWMKAIYAGEDPEAVYANTREELTTGLYPTAKLGSKRTISVAEKRVVDLGLGQPGDKIFVWTGPDGEPTTSGGYDIDHYVGVLVKMWEKFTVK